MSDVEQNHPNCWFYSCATNVGLMENGKKVSAEFERRKVRKRRKG